jgi:hypothetical protein
MMKVECIYRRMCHKNAIKTDEDALSLAAHCFPVICHAVGDNQSAGQSRKVVISYLGYLSYDVGT